MNPEPDIPGEVHEIAASSRRYADCFQLPLDRLTWRGHSGDFQGSGVGSSLDFQDHRNYLPGDDPRHINWQAYARTGNYSMKLYREEVRPVIEIILDVSNSLFFDPVKRRRTLELFYFCHFASIRSAATTSYFLVNGDRQRRIPYEAVGSHHWAGETGGLDTGASSIPPDLAPLPLRAQSLRILISDLLFPGNPEAIFRELTRSKGNALILCPFLRSEAEPEWDGNYEFVDSESSGHQERRVDPALLGRYRAAYRRHFENWKKSGIRHGLPVPRIPGEPDFETALQFEAIPSGAVQVGR